MNNAAIGITYDDRIVIDKAYDNLNDFIARSFNSEHDQQIHYNNSDCMNHLYKYLKAISVITHSKGFPLSADIIAEAISISEKLYIKRVSLDPDAAIIADDDKGYRAKTIIAGSNYLTELLLINPHHEAIAEYDLKILNDIELRLISLLELIDGYVIDCETDDDLQLLEPYSDILNAIISNKAYPLPGYILSTIERYPKYAYKKVVEIAKLEGAAHE